MIVTELDGFKQTGRDLVAGIEFFERVDNAVLAGDADLANEWVDLSDRVTNFRRGEVKLRGTDSLLMQEFNDEIDLYARFDQTIHRILVNPLFVYFICMSDEFARITEKKIELAIFSQYFTAAIPEMAGGMAATFGLSDKALN